MPDPSPRDEQPVGSTRASAPPGRATGEKRSALDRALRLGDLLLCWVLTAMMATMLIASVAQVLTRYVLETTLIGPEEVARYMMVGATFISIPVLARRRNHIAVDALAHYLPNGWPQSLLARIVLLFETLFLAGLTVYAFRLFRSVAESGQFSAGLEIPVAWPISALFIGTGLGTLMTAGMLVQTFLEPDPHGDEIVTDSGAMATGTDAPGGSRRLARDDER